MSLPENTLALDDNHNPAIWGYNKETEKVVPVNITKDWELSIVAKDFWLCVNQCEMDWYSAVDKFWVNSIITTSSDPEDIWEWGWRYIYDADWTAPIVSIWAETDAAANQDIMVSWLDINWNYVDQTITLNWTSRVVLTTPLWRVFRLQNEWNTSFTWYVFCYIWTWTVPSIWDPEIRALINNTNLLVPHNQTLMAIYSVPKWKVWFLTKWEIWIEATWNVNALADFAHIHYESRRFWKIFKVKKTVTCIVWWNSVFTDHRSFPGIIPAMWDIRLTVVEVSATMWVWGTFDILLVDESKFSEEYLTAIWQPWY